MKNQIYIIFATLVFLSSCKTDSPIEAADDIFYWKMQTGKFFHRQDTLVDLKSDIISPFTVNFDALNLVNGNLHYNLFLDGGDTLQFINGNCNKSIQEGERIDDNQNYSSMLVIEKINNGVQECSSDTSFFIAFKRLFKKDNRTNFGWIKIIKPLPGYWIIDEFAYNLGNHKSINTGQKE